MTRNKKGQFVKNTNEEFLKRAKKNVPYIKIFSKYNGSACKVSCECMRCGNKWETKAKNILRGNGCPKCNVSNPKLGTNEYISQIKEINPNIEIIGEYTGNNNRIDCRCKICGYKWSPFANSIKSGHGCPNCKALKDRLTHKEFVERMKNINPFVEIIGTYETSIIPIDVKCLICNKTFKAQPSNLLKKTGCPYCNLSKGERDVSIFLSNHNIKYIPQKTYCNLKGIGGRNLSYDFYLQDYNLLIEYQGRQHEQPIEGFVDENMFKYIKEHDRRKKKYAQDNNINLLEIWYNEDIEQKLKEALNLETVETAGN